MTKPTSDLDVAVLLGPDFTKHIDITQEGNVVIVKPKRRLPYSIYADLKKKVVEMGGSYRRKTQQFEIPVGEQQT